MNLGQYLKPGETNRIRVLADNGAAVIYHLFVINPLNLENHRPCVVIAQTPEFGSAQYSCCVNSPKMIMKSIAGESDAL